MASGCILGECPFCKNLIYEDNWVLVDDTMVHDQCESQYIGAKYGVSEEQLQRLYGIKSIKRDIEETKEELSSEEKYFTKEINVLKKRMEELGKAIKGV